MLKDDGAAVKLEEGGQEDTAPATAPGPGVVSPTPTETPEKTEPDKGDSDGDDDPASRVAPTDVVEARKIPGMPTKTGSPLIREEAKVLGQLSGLTRLSEDMSINVLALIKAKATVMPSGVRNYLFGFCRTLASLEVLAFEATLILEGKIEPDNKSEE